jgi:hypothetical protein
VTLAVPGAPGLGRSCPRKCAVRLRPRRERDCDLDGSGSSGLRAAQTRRLAYR